MYIFKKIILLLFLDACSVKNYQRAFSFYNNNNLI